MVVFNLAESVALAVLLALMGAIVLGLKHRSKPLGRVTAGVAAIGLVLAGPFLLYEVTIVHHYRIMFQNYRFDSFGASKPER